MDLLSLNGMRFYAYHGLYEQENREGQYYEVDLQLSLDLSRVCSTDSLEDGIDYSKVYETVRKEMETPSHLIEHVAERICQSVKRDFPKVKDVTIRLRKPHPPIEGSTIGCAEVVLKR